MLVEADGSRRLPLKAHAPHEPVIPKEAGCVLCVVGAHGFDRPIREAVHRPEQFCTLTGARPTSLLRLPLLPGRSPQKDSRRRSC